ncbi:DUF1376 domain-containing protein [Bradyrhizobium liaoningense]|uniref:YdaU family protein n=1 Tax=Bradyrhizobium liaoningense TaxID=43992 RepID=UPI001BAC2120|nr:DUF1376 domain-containing protein [Bradyrhizobium liaoningense]MBR0741184.1 DUF1376 domain-containing protein [Bradyrhizobium liaoningense]
MSRPWMPFYWGDYFRDTRHLTKLQHASYLMLIGHYWTHGGLPDDDRQLANITLSSLEEWQADKLVLQAFFYDGWKHKRIEAELVRTAKKTAQAKEKGQKGGLTTALNRDKLAWQAQRHK